MLLPKYKCESCWLDLFGQSFLHTVLLADAKPLVCGCWTCICPLQAEVAGTNSSVSSKLPQSFKQKFNAAHISHGAASLLTDMQEMLCLSILAEIRT